MSSVWSERAEAAENAIITRHLRRLWALPGTRLGVVAWPAVRRERNFLNWHYWWQAHLIDCLVDAYQRDQSPERRRRIAQVVRGHRVRNMSGWTNSYYDDMAWLGLAVERAQSMAPFGRRHVVDVLADQVFDVWDPERGGGIPWRKGSDFFNTPANGPAAILLARTGRVPRAIEMADWIDKTLRDDHTNLILDGIHIGGEFERAIYSYCQGVVLGLETELAVRTGQQHHRMRVHRLIDALDHHLTWSGVIRGGGGGDGGLFDGILARYLALVATELPGDDIADIRARVGAAEMVLASAEEAWGHRLQVEGLPLFGNDWSKQARLPSSGSSIATFTAGSVRSSAVPERDLSVQLSGWMLMEAAHVVSAAGFGKRR
ncbi:MAG: fructose-bisphosphate aldolase [Rhodococcus sp.]|nr:fructose-bisphosphate aldolase [Rhodococcus sp. (in: high G+C Gram-positive bacteria)]